VIPCHRVVGANGSLTGYGGGLARKRALLDFEASGGAPEVMAASWGRRQLALL
jgi:alkylated DNA nucleotide flippase Atl1